MKRAIYLDDRERELTRRVLAYVISRLEGSFLGATELEKMAATWTRDEIVALNAKFAEPDPAKRFTRIE